MNHGQAFAAFSADGFGERMFEDFRDWVNEPDQTSPTTGYYLRGDDGFRYIDGETPEVQDGRWTAFEEAKDDVRAVTRFGLGVFAERVKPDDPEDTGALQLSALFIILPPSVV